MAFPHDDLDMVLSLTPEFWSRFSGARILITGGTGFIGTWLIESLQRANDLLGSRIELVVLSRDPGRARKKAPDVFDRRDTKLITGDVNSFRGAVGNLDICIHAATDVGDPRNAVSPLGVYDTIVCGTQRMLELAHASGASRFLLTSSGAIYGTQPTDLERIPEIYVGAPDPLNHRAAYANGKRAAEWLACAHASGSGFDSLIARIFAVIGPGLPLNGSFAAGNFVRDVLTGKVIRVQGDGRPRRSYIYMADLCVWLLRILASGAPGQAYNVGSEHAVSIALLAERVAEVADSNVHIIVESTPELDMPEPRYVPDTSKARNELGLAEYTLLDDALRKTINWSRLSIGL